MKCAYPRPGIRLPARLALLSCLLLGAFSAIDAAAQCASPVFPGAARYAAGSRPNSIATGEFNGDGVKDLAVANLVSGDVSILLGDGAGGFGPPGNFAVPMKPEGLAVGDFNKDGRADLTVAHNFREGLVTVLFGDGAGTFSPPAVVAKGFDNEVVAVAVGDFNGDGNPDIAAARRDWYQLILLGDGAGGFAVRTVYTPGYVNSVAAADFNGDGKTDAVFGTDSGQLPWGVLLVLGSGSGYFSSNFEVSLDRIPTGLAVADFNGDGRPDLTVGVGYDKHSLVILLNNGAGGFFLSNEAYAGSSPAGVAAGDFNGDGMADAAATTPYDNQVLVALGDGTGKFSGARHYGAAPGAASVATADFNADGRADLATANRGPVEPQPGTGDVSVLLGQGGGTFDSYSAYKFYANYGLRLRAFTAGDFKNNGRPDLVVAFTDGASQIVMRNDGAGGFIPPAYYNPQSEYPTSYTVADFNGDNNLDKAYVYGSLYGSPAVVAVHLGNGAGIFPDRYDYQVNSKPTFVAHGDFNGDGKRDLIVTDESAEALVLLGNGAGRFARPPGSVFPAIKEIAVADFNGDGRTDVAAANFPQNSLSILLGNASGTLTHISTTPLPAQNVRSRPAAADVNLDGRPDVVTANPETDSVSIFLGDGAGGLHAAASFPAGNNPSSLAVADFNGDGRPDVATANVDLYASQSTLTVLAGDGAGGLGPAVEQSAGLDPRELFATDFNQDGRMDLAVASRSHSALAILTNIYAPLPCLSVGDVAMTEGDAGARSADFTVSLSAPAAGPVRVNYSLSGVSASPGADFSALGGRIVFAPGETSRTVSVPVGPDALDEDDETFKISLASPSGASIADGEGTGTILDDDPTPALSVGDVTVAEVTYGTGKFTVTLSAPSGKAVTVRYATADVSATGGNLAAGDYSPVSGTLTIPAGQTTAEVSVTIWGDSARELDEQFSLVLSEPTNATLQDGEGRATITDDDPVPSLTVTSTSVAEGNGGTKNVLLSVSLSNLTYQPVTLSYATGDDAAAAGSDYAASSGTITLNPFEGSKNISFSILGDTVDELNERFYVTVSDVQNATVATGTGSVIIVDDDGPAVSVDDISVKEGQSGTTGAAFTLTLSAASVQNVTVRVATAPGTATHVTDYTPLSFNVTIPAGTLSRTVTVPVVGDTAAEPDENFFLNLSNPTNATIAKAQGICVVKDDDSSGAGSFRLSSASYSAAEGSGGVTITVERAGDTSRPASVDYATSDLSASDLSDYILALGTLRFAAGETVKTFRVLVNQDSHAEGTEALSVTLSNPSGGAVIDNVASATVEITDDAPESSGNAIDDAGNFVAQHYRDFFGREADQAGLDFWAGQITECGLDAGCIDTRRQNVSAAFFTSIEFQETGYLVYRTHKASFGDAPGSPAPVAMRDLMREMRQIGDGVVVGQGDWQARLEANKAAYFTALVESEKFSGQYQPAMAAQQFVERLNQNSGGALDSAEAADLAAKLDSGQLTRAQVVRAVAEDRTLYDAEYRKAFVYMQYVGYLRRDPDQLGFDFWLGKLNNHNGDYISSEMIRSFIVSSEYRDRFGR